MLLNNVTAATNIFSRLNDTLNMRRFTGDEIYLYEAANNFLTVHFKIQAKLLKEWLERNKDVEQSNYPYDFGSEDGDTLSGINPS